MLGVIKHPSTGSSARDLNSVPPCCCHSGQFACTCHPSPLLGCLWRNTLTLVPDAPTLWIRSSPRGASSRTCVDSTLFELYGHLLEAWSSGPPQACQLPRTAPLSNPGSCAVNNACLMPDLLVKSVLTWRRCTRDRRLFRTRDGLVTLLHPRTYTTFHQQRTCSSRITFTALLHGS